MIYLCVIPLRICLEFSSWSPVAQWMFFQNQLKCHATIRDMYLQNAQIPCLPDVDVKAGESIYVECVIVLGLGIVLVCGISNKPKL